MYVTYRVVVGTEVEIYRKALRIPKGTKQVLALDF